MTSEPEVPNIFGSWISDYFLLEANPRHTSPFNIIIFQNELVTAILIGMITNISIQGT